MSVKTLPNVYLVGGEDIHLRIPFIHELEQKGFTVTACGTAGETIFRNAGLQFKKYLLNRKFSPLSDYQSIRQLRRLFSEERPDIVHAFDTKPGILAPFAAGAPEIPVVMRTITGLGSAHSSDDITSRMLRVLYRSLQKSARARCQMTVFQNADDKAYFSEKGMTSAGQHALISGSGVDVAGLRSLAASYNRETTRNELSLGDQTICIMVARLVRQKGVADFLKAAALVRKELPSVAFLLVGPSDTAGSNAVPLNEVSTYEDDVIYLGPRDDVAALFAASDICVLPTLYREGVPRCLLEAGTLGLPLVATDTPGCRDVVVDQWNGLLVHPGDPAGLSSAILTLASDPQAQTRMGRNSADHIRENFDLPIVANQYADLYLQLWEEAQSA